MEISALFVCLLCLTSSIRFGTPLLVPRLLPNNPRAEFGKSLELYCHVNASEDNLNSSSICFTHGLDEYCGPSDYVTIENSTTAKFTYPNMTFERRGHHSCWLLGFKPVRGRQSVNVIRRPHVPRNISCVAWNNLTCSWLPSYSDQHKYTTDGAHNVYGLNQTLMWTQGTTNDSRTCPPNSELECPCNANSGISCANVGLPTWGAAFCVNVTASNSIGATSLPVCYNDSNFKDIVKPDRLSVLNISSYNTSTVISLAPPHRTVQPPIENFEFSLTYRLHWMMESSNLITNTSRVQLETLPDSKYAAKVTVKPAGFGLWSDETPFEFSTPPAAPSRSPVTDPSAFEISEFEIQKGRPRKLTIYWKKLEPQYYFGPNFKYLVVGRSADNESWNELGNVTNQSQLLVYLAREEREVAVVSHNDIGTTLPRVTIIVPTTKSPVLMLNALRDTEVGRNSSLVVYRWTSEASVNFTHFVLFWCQSHVHGYCSSDINWLKVPGDVREHTIQLANNSGLMYGVAGVSGSLSTGVRWISNDCVYKFTDYPNPPVNVKVSAPSDGDLGELDVTWSQPRCSKGYILHYELHYCRLLDTQDCADLSNVNVTANVTEYRLKGLNHGVKYSVWLYSVTRVGRSEQASTNDSAISSAYASRIKPGTIAGICLSVVCILAFVAILTWKCVSRCCKYRREFTAGLNIYVPETMQSVPSDLPGSSSYAEYAQMSIIRDQHEYGALSPVDNVAETTGLNIYDDIGAVDLALPSDEQLYENDDDETRGGAVTIYDNSATSSVTIRDIVCGNVHTVRSEGVPPFTPAINETDPGAILAGSLASVPEDTEVELMANDAVDVSPGDGSSQPDDDVSKYAVIACVSKLRTAT